MAVHENYIKVKGKWVYLYLAVDQDNQVIDFMLSEKRTRYAAYSFLKKAIGKNGLPTPINIDKNGINKAGIEHYNRKTNTKIEPDTINILITSWRGIIDLLNEESSLCRDSNLLNQQKGHCMELKW